MKRILMNKNREVLCVNYNDILNGFDKLYNIIDIEYAPLIIKNYYNTNIDEVDFLNKLSSWFIGRGIPSWRDKLDLLLHRLNINAPGELLDKSFGLSLSDQYWLKPYDSDILYEDINFFDNDFNFAEFMEASLSKNSNIIQSKKSLETPNNTTDGMLRKAWIIEDGVRYLIKGGYKNETLQPFNEVLASEICKRLGFNHVEYKLDTYKDTVVSKCPCFINKDTEFITCSQILHNKKKYSSIKDYQEYINILEDNGINNARVDMENMYVLDYIIMNEDRHLNNFGIIRNVNDLKWIGVAPIFDNGQSLNIEYYDEDELHIAGEGRFFYEVKPFDEIIDIVKDINRFDFSVLDDLPEWFDNLLTKYQYITGYSDTRINRLCILLNRQINRLKKLQNK